MADDVEGIVRTVINEAKSGDMTAARLILDRIAPIRRGQPISLELPKVTDAQGVAAASGKVVAAVAEGVLTPDEGKVFAEILEARRRTIELIEFEGRLASLEEKIK